MDLIDEVRNITSRVKIASENIQSEEATKLSVINPMIRALGYDVANPLEVIPEFTADIGQKKGEKVDYAIKKDNEIIMLIECKPLKSDLNEQQVRYQLARYFQVTDTKLGVLTNGNEYKFYSDIEKDNIMDDNPFFVFNLLDFEDDEDDDITELKRFAKSQFSLKEILSNASNLKYTGSLKKIFDSELENPSPEFVEFFARKIYKRKLTKNKLQEFTPIVKRAREQFIAEKIRSHLKSAENSLLQKK